MVVFFLTVPRLGVRVANIWEIHEGVSTGEHRRVGGADGLPTPAPARRRGTPTQI